MAPTNSARCSRDRTPWKESAFRERRSRRRTPTLLRRFQGKSAEGWWYGARSTRGRTRSRSRSANEAGRRRASGSARRSRWRSRTARGATHATTPAYPPQERCLSMSSRWRGFRWGRTSGASGFLLRRMQRGGARSSQSSAHSASSRVWEGCGRGCPTNSSSEAPPPSGASGPAASAQGSHPHPGEDLRGGTSVSHWVRLQRGGCRCRQRWRGCCRRCALRCGRMSGARSLSRKGSRLSPSSRRSSARRGQRWGSRSSFPPLSAVSRRASVARWSRGKATGRRASTSASNPSSTNRLCIVHR
mmetsp:Transcript_2357/g.5586  ORF Transcript_2357/g.5586 Transcript_2357/m.5586 type:complete len:302 (-) Transcript_2357:330-1235(-)